MPAMPLQSSPIILTSARSTASGSTATPINTKGANASATQSLQGKVIGVADGDEVTLLVGNKHVKVYLYGIDCPDKGQPFSERARQFTSVLTFDKTATLYSEGTDRHGRIVGWLFISATCVNRELISNGLAWWYQEAAPDEIKLDDLEQRAREAKVGLWSEPEPVAPWEWRRGLRPNLEKLGAKKVETAKDLARDLVVRPPSPDAIQ